MKLNRLATPLAGVLLLAVALGSPAGAQVGKSEHRIDPNLATAEQLAALPGLTPEQVKAISAHRPYLTLLDLNAQLGSMEAEAKATLLATLFVPINLNSATREELLLIPGVGARMAHEFEEYRPYKGLAQFRREIGKYVDEAEVARLEQYVFVPIRLNTATDEEILSIPGVGKRMLHEFKEYRPYKSLEQFQKEIGKYVDAHELKRLEGYVTLD
ncbi:MAG: helix-hairpin-helix domain-containing protein [Candidatus Eisenbacteria bacterium]|nr:helix-hairpin-helix domain-containing protein [Candidatus Eisenbacteria bacterium]MCC7142309.1 helix-hairpin-helix domain-containing protein [Candidatus Eisenbacteria bacterium]